MAQWLVIVPDIAGAQAKRLAVRAKHLEAAGTRYSLGGESKLGEKGQGN